MTTLGWIRHGETDWNQLGKMQGQMDIPLNETGRRQALALAERLTEEQWDCIITSDLSRALDTARCISERTGIPIASIDGRLRERAFGKAEGASYHQIVAEYGQDWRELERFGVEGDQLLYSRVIGCIDEIVQQYDQQKVLLVSHGGVLRVLLSRLLGKEKQEHIRNTSLSIMTKNENEWVEVLYNCAKHLDMA